MLKNQKLRKSLGAKNKDTNLLNVLNGAVTLKKISSNYECKKKIVLL